VVYQFNFTESPQGRFTAPGPASRQGFEQFINVFTHVLNIVRKGKLFFSHLDLLSFTARRYCNSSNNRTDDFEKEGLSGTGNISRSQAALLILEMIFVRLPKEEALPNGAGDPGQMELSKFVSLGS